MPGYFKRKFENDPKIDMKISILMAVNKQNTSHFDGYVDAMDNQEIPTKLLNIQHAKGASATPKSNNKCR